MGCKNNGSSNLPTFILDTCSYSCILAVMIERTNAFKVGDKSFLTLADAQKYELVELAKQNDGIVQPENVANWLLANKDKVLDILTTTSTSKPKARRINGGTKMRKVNPATALAVKESVRISLPPKPTSPPTIKLPENVTV